MSNHEIYKKAFSGITYPGTIRFDSHRESRISSSKYLLVAAIVAVMLISTVFAAEFTAITSYFKVFLRGEPTEIEVVEYDPGEFRVTLPDGKEISFSQVSSEQERLTAEEVLDSLQVSVNVEDNRVYFFCYDKKTDITDQFDAAGRCFLTAEIGGETRYITVFSHENRYVVVNNDTEFIQEMPG